MTEGVFTVYYSQYVLPMSLKETETQITRSYLITKIFLIVVYLLLVEVSCNIRAKILALNGNHIMRCEALKYVGRTWYS